nr:NADH dehydrogenase subunit 2 [Scapholeberis mucronata]
MLFSPSLVMFTTVLTISVLLLMSSPSLLMCWVALELNTLSFIPLMTEVKNKLTSESSIKYFLVQTFASVVFVVSSLVTSLGVLTEVLSCVMFLSLAIKLGAGPFQSWVLSVSDSLPWFPLYLLLTVQKINPFILVIFLTDSLWSLMLIVVVVSLITGAVGGLNQTSSRGILVFSSINHLGWLLTACMLSINYFYSYFLLYSFMLIVPSYFLDLWQVNSVNQMNSSFLKTSQRLYLVVGLLSLGGLPPFLGFLPKWLILQTLLANASWSLCIVMVFTSVITLYFYLRLSFSGIILATSSSGILTPTNGLYQNSVVGVSLMMTSVGLPLMFIL